MPRAKAKLPPRRPDSERRHWVFLRACGCPFGLVEQGDTFKTEDNAWDAMWDTRADERRARADGVTSVFVNHAEYVAKYYDRMTKPCPHRGA